MNTKKIPYYLALFFLTTGASLILGFLSFGGMYALLPFLPFAFAAFGLSVVYEGEIYLQNIKGALTKLFKNNYLKNHLAKEFLLEHFPQNTDDPDCPEFFKDYEKQLKLLALFGHKNLTPASRKQQKQVEKKLRDMEKWFALQLFPDDEEQEKKPSEYTRTLRKWLAKDEQKQAEWQEKLAKRRTRFHLVSAFSTLAALFMSLGSTYLIVEAFSVIPWIAAIPFTFWPIIIIPMALIAGAAYGLLTYNTITDLINNDTLNKWYQKLRKDLSAGLSIRNVFMVAMALILAGLAIALTICTAGTWWTVASNARPLFEWMGKMPQIIMGVINPLITGLSALFFNLQNTAESLEILDEMTRSKTNIFQRIYTSIRDGIAHLGATENWLQILNPFRIILKLTVTPLRILFFLGHLASIALTADRMPGVPEIVAALIAMISEGFEDAHYFEFFGHAHGHDDHDHEHHSHHKDTKNLRKERLDSAAGHNHNVDIPTKILKALFLPLYALAAAWDYLASKMNPATSTVDDGKTKQPKILSWKKAWDKQRGNEKEVNVHLPAAGASLSEKWNVEHAVSLMQKYEKKHLKGVVIGTKVAAQKKDELQKLQAKLRDPQGESAVDLLIAAKANPVYNQHRLFAPKNTPTSTQTFVAELSQRVYAIL